MTEQELRRRVADTILSWKGAVRGSNTHVNVILATYNNYKPLARGYKVQVKDAWCATTVSAVLIKIGIAKYIGTECSCSRFIDIAKSKGIWVEDDNHLPKIGDFLLYSWNDKANYAKYDNMDAPNHIGIVTSVTANSFIVCEGNKGSRSEVGTRPVARNGRYIRGFICPDYAAIAAELTKAEKPEVTYTAGKTNEETIFNFCTQVLGMNKAGACGVVANIVVESGCNPTKSGDNGTSYGICQWHGSRMTAMKKWCGNNYTKLDSQLWYLKYELECSYPAVLSYMKTVANTAQGAYDAGSHWCAKFEVPNNTAAVSAVRGNMARNTYWPRYGQLTSAVKPYVYVVKAGDSLSKISALFNVPVADLARWNNITNPAKINIGQEIYITEASAAIDRLGDLGILSSPNYWQTAVSAEKVKYLDQLLIKANSKIKSKGTKISTVENALARLVAVGVINSPNYWKEHYNDYGYLADLIMLLGGAVQ